MEMKILVFAETFDGLFKKSTYESVHYGASIAEAHGGSVLAVVIGKATPLVEDLGKYGASEVVHINPNETMNFDSSAYASLLDQIADEQGAQAVIISGTTNGRALSGALAWGWDAGLLSNAVTLPSQMNPTQVKTKCFSSKGFAHAQSSEERVIISFIPQSIGIQEHAVEASVTDVDMPVNSALQVVSADRVSGKVPLPEAECVVSAGRGLKGPENWGMIEELAQVLGASTACSKPVSDMGWRPHSEHVGQTGIAINPEIYFAIGISGAIQHLAGVSASKNIIVINKDPEAPFFKSADFGMVGDAFEIVLELTRAIAEIKNQG